MGLAHRGARLDTQLLDETSAQVPVDGQRLGRAAGAMQDEHQQAVETLPQRMLGDTSGQHRYQTAESGSPDVQLGLTAPFQGEQSRLRQAPTQRAPRPPRQAAERVPRQSASAAAPSRTVRSQSPSACAVRAAAMWSSKTRTSNSPSSTRRR